MFTRNFSLILIGNVVLSAAMPMLIVLGALAGAQLAPQMWLTTGPPSAQMIAGILIASPISLFMGRHGRKAGFLVGAAVLTLGGLLGAASLHLQSFAMLCFSHFVLGAAMTCVNYFRFAAAESVSEPYRPQAISLTLASGLIAALVGPEIFAHSKDAIETSPLAGAYLAMAILGIVGVVPLLGLKLPPLTVRSSISSGSVLRVLQTHPQLFVPIGIAALSQAIMVLLMTPTPLAMVNVGFMEEQAADVIRWHVVAMFAPGFFSGYLIKQFGDRPIAIAGLGLLLISAIIALLGLNAGNFYVSLVLLGVGWNFGFVSGTHMLQASLNKQNQAQVQGANDTLLAVSSSLASLLSGALYSGLGWIGLAAITAPVVALMSVLLFRAEQKATAL